MIFADAEQLRRMYGPHDLIVRARVDVLFEESLLLITRDVMHALFARRPSVLVAGFHALHSTLAHQGYPLEPPVTVARCRNKTGPMDSVNLYSAVALPYCPLGKKLVWHWRDWIFVGREQSIVPLGEMVAKRMILASRSERCAGLCQEEQTIMHLREANVSVLPLGVRVGIARVPCYQRDAVAEREDLLVAATPAIPTVPRWADACSGLVNLNPLGCSSLGMRAQLSNWAGGGR